MSIWDYILDHIGEFATEQMVIEEFGGKSLEQIKAELDEIFPEDNNEALAEMIYQVVP